MTRFYELLSEVLEEPSVSPESILRDFELWDSLTALTTLSMVSKNFHVTVSGEELSSVRTAGDLYRIVEAKTLVKAAS